MLKKIILVLSFSFCLHIEAQSTKDTIVEDHSIAAQLYTKCFTNLNQANDFLKTYPSFQNVQFSLITSSFLLSYKETEIQQVGENLLRGITTQLYREGNPVHMISGMESYLYAEEKNKNLLDDDRIVYISYGECVNPLFLHRAADIINEETRKLISQNKKTSK